MKELIKQKKNFEQFKLQACLTPLILKKLNLENATVYLDPNIPEFLNYIGERFPEFILPIVGRLNRISFPCAKQILFECIKKSKVQMIQKLVTNYPSLTGAEDEKGIKSFCLKSFFLK